MKQPRVGVTALIVAVLAIVIWIHWGHGPELGADDHGQYLLHAKALVEGRPYTDIGFIHSQYSTLVAPIAEPPGLPVLIAGVFSLAGMHEQAPRVILYVSFALFILTVFFYFRRITRQSLAAFIALWTLVALGRTHALDTMLADLSFCATLWLAFLIADRSEVQGWKTVLGLALAGAAAFTFRMAALPLLPAAATALVLRKNEERVGFFVVGALWTAAAAAVMFGLPAAEVLAGESVRSFSTIASDVQINIRAIWEGARAWSPLWLPHRLPNLIVHLVFLAIAGMGILVAFPRNMRRFAFICGAWYVVMLVILPTRAARYLWPLFPLMTYGFLTGIEVIARALTLPDARRSLVTACIASVVAALGLFHDAIAPRPRSYTEMTDVQEVRDVLHQQASNDAEIRVVIFSPRVAAWEDGFTTMNMFDAPNDTMLAFLRENQITHVVSGDAGTYAIGAAGIARLVDERPDAFTELKRNNTFRVFSLNETSK